MVATACAVIPINGSFRSSNFPVHITHADLVVRFVVRINAVDSKEDIQITLIRVDSSTPEEVRRLVFLE
jgi:hypothetical protein